MPKAGKSNDPKECRAFSINICPFPNWITIETITSPHPYISVEACKIDLKFCISKPKSPYILWSKEESLPFKVFLCVIIGFNC